MLILSPLQVYRWHRQNHLAYFVELCWVSAFAIAGYLWILFLAPQLVPMAARAVALRVIFAFGSGPLGWAVTFLGNALIPHSIDYTMSLMIHLVPLFTSFALRWHDCDQELFPIDNSVGFAEYYLPALICLAIWAAFHTVFMLAIGIHLPPRIDRNDTSKTPTTYSYAMVANGGKNAYTSVLGKLGDGSSEVMRFMKYEVISVSFSAASLALSYAVYMSNIQIHFALVAASAFMSAWNGGSWYEARLDGCLQCIEKLRKDE